MVERVIGRSFLALSLEFRQTNNSTSHIYSELQCIEPECKRGRWPSTFMGSDLIHLLVVISDWSD